MSQEVYRSGCWDCLKAQQDPTEKYVCPQYQQHQKEYQKIQEKLD
ncbi:MAG: hypothetical protein MRECE_2c077 [Mycoplasmataceae bacterium CE_OT135]|nr:MAG: hypothetical protein MRECE_2c077 [Mycoplasmataceae bacterium CE_OT135]